MRFSAVIGKLPLLWNFLNSFIGEFSPFSFVLQDVFNNLYTSKISTSLLNNDIMAALKEDIKSLLISCDFEKSTILDYLTNKGWNDNHIQCFLTLFEKYRSKLLYVTVINHNASFSEVITNFDWNLKLVLGSSELKALRYPLLQLAFSTKTPVGQEEKYGCELNKNILAKMIDILESALK